MKNRDFFLKGPYKALLRASNELKEYLLLVDFRKIGTGFFVGIFPDF